MVGESTIVVTLQNGLGNEDVLSNAFPDSSSVSLSTAPP